MDFVDVEEEARYTKIGQDIQILVFRRTQWKLLKIIGNSRLYQVMQKKEKVLFICYGSL